MRRCLCSVNRTSRRLVQLSASAVVERAKKLAATCISIVLPVLPCTSCEVADRGKGGRGWSPHPVHDDGVQGGLAVLVRRPAEADRQVALIRLASRAALSTEARFCWRRRPEWWGPMLYSMLFVRSAARCGGLLGRGHSSPMPRQSRSLLESAPSVKTVHAEYDALQHLLNGVDGWAGAVLRCDGVPGRLCAASMQLIRD